MKEATGELNMTVITVLIIAALGVIGITVVIPAINGGLAKQSCASALGLKANEVTYTKSTKKCCETKNLSNCIELTDEEAGS